MASHNLKQKLATERDELRTEIRKKLRRAAQESYVELVGRVHDVAEESVGRFLLDVDYASIEHDVDKLPQLDEALHRLDDATYGVCIDCGEEIPPERLRALPTAERCVECQARFERLLRPRALHYPTL